MKEGMKAKIIIELEADLEPIERDAGQSRKEIASMIAEVMADGAIKNSAPERNPKVLSIKCEYTEKFTVKA